MKNLVLISVAVAVFLPVFHSLAVTHSRDDSSSSDITSKVPEQLHPKKRFFLALFTGLAAVTTVLSNVSKWKRKTFQEKKPDSFKGSELVSEELSHEQLYKLLRDNSVSLAELYVRPLDADANPKIVKAQGGKQFGIVASLEEGNRVLLTAGDRKGQGQDVVNLSIATDDAMSEGGWKKVWTKKISGATLGDFVEAGLNDVDSLPGSS